MNGRLELSPGILSDMRGKDIDIERSLSILQDFNAGRLDLPPVRARSLPDIDNRLILDRTKPDDSRVYLLQEQKISDALDNHPELRSIPGIRDGQRNPGGEIRVREAALREAGFRLLPFLSYGILNGGSATSYVDSVKNEQYDPDVYRFLKRDFESCAQFVREMPKGITPAFFNIDGTPGPSFMELKLRSVLLQAARYSELTGKAFPSDGILFQMTSIGTDRPVRNHLAELAGSPLLADLISHTGIRIDDAYTELQPMIAAFTHSSEGKPKRIFTDAHGLSGSVLALPGGHGQCFSVLKPVFRRLLDAGKRFVYLGNVDNSGYTIDPVSLALVALSGAPAGFDFSFKTPFDTKGGILVEDDNGKITCADIGPAISEEEVAAQESGGKTALFNCATGLFDLRALVNGIDGIISSLPVRFTDQKKDAGSYSQAEQVTWEVIGILKDPLVFAVDKYRRFLAAKLLLENMLTSGWRLEDPDFPVTPHAAMMRNVAQSLHSGLERVLNEECGMEADAGRWVPSATR